MNANKQLINLAGILVVVVILVAGVALIAVPMFTQAQATDTQTQTVAQSNSVYEAQVAALSKANDGIDAIDADLADLRTEIAAQPKLDDVLEIIDAAAETTAATIESITVADPVSWTARGAVVDTSGTGVPVAAPTPAPTEEATETDTGETDAAADTTATDTAPAADPSAVTAQAQVLVSITVTVADAKTAASFVDALRVGPRLILPIDSTLADGKLTVQALAFIRTEDAQ